MFEFTENYDLLPNICVKTAHNYGSVVYHQIYPVDGYVLRIPVCDTYKIDENGEFVLDANGNKIIDEEYRTAGGAMVVKDYEWEKNPNQYTAEKFNKNMTVY